MTVTSAKHSLTDAFGIAATNLDKVAKQLTPCKPGKPAIKWGCDKGTFELLDQSSHLLGNGRARFAEIFTRRQAGKLIDALGTDVDNVFALRDMAMAVQGGSTFRKYLGAPALTPAVAGDLAKAAADARAAVAMLNGKFPC